jgi:hypothetical protein
MASPLFFARNDTSARAQNVTTINNSSPDRLFDCANPQRPSRGGLDAPGTDEPAAVGLRWSAVSAPGRERMAGVPPAAPRALWLRSISLPPGNPRSTPDDAGLKRAQAEPPNLSAEYASIYGSIAYGALPYARLVRLRAGRNRRGVVAGGREGRASMRKNEPITSGMSLNYGAWSLALQ